MCQLFLLKKPTQRLNGKKCTDLNRTKHNSNHKTQQITLEGEIIQEYHYYVLGFLPEEVIKLKRKIWFTKLTIDQIISAKLFIERK